MAKSLQEFREWTVSKGKNIPNPPPASGSALWPGECVSLIQQYLYQVFGIQWAARGHAYSFVPPGFQQLSPSVTLKPGDIVRYPANINAAGVGHIELIDDDGRALAQNRTGNKTVTRGAILPGYTAVFRPSKSFAVRKGSNTSTGGTMLTTKTQLNNLYQAVFRTARVGNEGEDVYLNKDSGWVFNDLMASKRRKNVLAAATKAEDTAKVNATALTAERAKSAALQTQLNAANQQIKSLQDSAGVSQGDSSDAYAKDTNEKVNWLVEAFRRIFK